MKLPETVLYICTSFIAAFFELKEKLDLKGEKGKKEEEGKIEMKI